MQGGKTRLMDSKKSFCYSDANYGTYMDYAAAFEKLKTINQTHLLDFFTEIDAVDQTKLLNEIDQLDIATFKKQQELLFHEKNLKDEPIQPIKNCTKVGNIQDVSFAKKMVETSQVGCLIVAGGQGSRLQFKGPKGLFLVSPVCKKSLFQIFAEKVVAAGKAFGLNLPLAIMTSKDNDEEVQKFFKEHDYFGLVPEQISFFSQDNLPILDIEGNLFLSDKGAIATGPDGNGNALKKFVISGIYRDWLAKGVRYVNYLLIDNPLADPFDLKMVSSKHPDVVIKCIKREDPKENVGVLVEKNGMPQVVEYSEIDETERLKKDASGNLLYSLANISRFCFSMDFIKKIGNVDLPLHQAFKAVSYLGTTMNAYKFETFIFDVLPFANKVEVLEDMREDCFSPLKDLNSLNHLQEAMQKCDHARITEITGIKEDVLKPFEIAQEFYYPTEGLKAKWKGKKIPDQHYIQPDYNV